jgi:hypothetical protein
MRYFGLLGGVSTLGIFVLGFFTDEEQVSFHWPLPGYLALLVVVPCVLDTWPRGWRRATSALALAGLLAMLGYYLAVSVPALRQSSADSKFYPRNFAGWTPLAAAVRDELEKLPPGTRIVADDFKLGAELGFALGDADIAVLDHPLNRKHGRAPQLRLWGLEGGSVTGWRLLVLAPDDVRLRELLGRYHAVCRMLGPLPPPLRTVSVDHGATRFLLFALPPARNAGAACVTPGMAWIDQPLPGQRVGRQFVLRGWAFKDGAGLDRVDVTLDGVPLARARYGLPRDVRGYWKESTDPQHPHVGFEADISLPRVCTAGIGWACACMGAMAAAKIGAGVPFSSANDGRLEFQEEKWGLEWISCRSRNACRNRTGRMWWSSSRAMTKKPPSGRWLRSFRRRCHMPKSTFSTTTRPTVPSRWHRVRARGCTMWLARAKAMSSGAALPTWMRTSTFWWMATIPMMHSPPRGSSNDCSTVAWTWWSGPASRATRRLTAPVIVWATGC